MAQKVSLNTLLDYDAHMQLCPLISALHKKKRIIIIAGAGISASAGIPTFSTMSAGRRKLFDMSMYNSPKSTAILNEMMCDMYRCIEAATPTQFHLLIAALAEEGRLQRLYTQNIDGIDTQLPLLKTIIPLPKKKPWPKTIQLHGDLRTVRCQMYPSTHLSRFDPALFASGSPSYCAECEEGERLYEGRRRPRPIPVIRPRIWLYQDFAYPDAEAIDLVIAADFSAKPDAVIVVGTALKVDSAKIFVRDMCHQARKNNGFTAWINLKAPPQDLDCFDLAVEGTCDTVAKHVSSWWLKECPSVLSDTQIQELQRKCNLFIARSAEAALKRAFTELDDDSLSKILQQGENKSRVLNIKDDNRTIFTMTERPQYSGSKKSEGINYNLETVSKCRKNPPLAPTPVPSESSDLLPSLPNCWEMEMSKRLSNVIVQETGIGHKSLSVITNITDLGYKEQYLANSLWRLKPGEELNDEILNAYLELLRRSAVSTNLSIEGTHVLNLKSGSRLRRSHKLIQTGLYSIFIPIHEDPHWSFAVITSKEKDGPVEGRYYDSLGGGPPAKFLSWLDERFPKAEVVNGSPNPVQRNGVDCGLFVLMGIRLMTAGRRHLSQTQSDDIVPKFRQKVLAELLACSLNPSSSQFEEFKLKEAHADTDLSQVSPIGKGSISTTTDNQDHRVDSTKRYSSTRLSVSSSHVSDSGDMETDSSDALDKSEEELVQVKPLVQKASRTKKSPEEIAFTFAEEVSMVKTLREAVSIERASRKGPRNPKIENMQLADLWFMISTEKQTLKRRYLHYEFSRQFWAEMREFDRRPHQRGPVPKATISGVMNKLEVTNLTNWKYVLQQARRASIWTELADIFKDDLEHPSVVLCAVPNPTYTLETMTLTDRKVFFETIRSRLEGLDNGILARLKAAAPLCWAVMHNDLPAMDLPIESADEELPFEQVVSSEK